MRAMSYEVVARAASERGEVVLRRDGAVYELRVNGVFVMDTAESASEVELARVALGVVDRASDVLVGGLGMGFTAREVLADARVERLHVVEIEEAVIGWLRDGTVPHGPAYLADERMTVVNADIREAVAEARPDGFDLVLLDIDNGPGFLVYDENRSVYEETFLGRIREALRDGGALVVWSAAETEPLQRAMAAVFGNCEAVPHPVRLQTRDECYWLYLSRLSVPEPG
jgi:spermidine synthase